MLENLLLQLLQREKTPCVEKYLESNLIIIPEMIVFTLNSWWKWIWLVCHCFGGTTGSSRVGNTGVSLLLSGTAGWIFARHFESESSRKSSCSLHSNCIAKKLFVFMINWGNGELLRAFRVIHWKGKVVFTELIGIKLSQLSKCAAHQRLLTGPPCCSDLNFSSYYAIFPTKEHFKFLNHQI